MKKLLVHSKLGAILPILGLGQEDFDFFKYIIIYFGVSVIDRYVSAIACYLFCIMHFFPFVRKPLPLTLPT